MSQPEWECLWRTDYELLLKDKTGVYTEELEVAQEYEEDGETYFDLYRVCLDRQQIWIDPDDGQRYLIFGNWDPSWPKGASCYQEWFVKDLGDVARYCGNTVDEMWEWLCSENPTDRARAYSDIGGYLGFDNFDSYPLKRLTEDDLEARWDGLKENGKPIFLKKFCVRVTKTEETSGWVDVVARDDADARNKVDGLNLDNDKNVQWGRPEIDFVIEEVMPGEET